MRTTPSGRSRSAARSAAGVGTWHRRSSDQLLGLELEGVPRDAAHRAYQGKQVEPLADRPGPAAGEGVGTDDRPGVLVHPLAVWRLHGDHTASADDGTGRGLTPRCSPTRRTRMAIS